MRHITVFRALNWHHILIHQHYLDVILILAVLIPLEYKEKLTEK